MLLQPIPLYLPKKTTGYRNVSCLENYALYVQVVLPHIDILATQDEFWRVEKYETRLDANNYLKFGTTTEPIYDKRVLG